MGSLSRIDHIVVLMLENRSFDCLFGALYPRSVEFDGLLGTESNADAAGNPVAVWNARGNDPATMSIPTPDPGELWTDMNQQLFGAAIVPVPTPAARMSGFVANYLQQTGQPAPIGRNVMHYFLPEQLPVISGLARQFAVSDRWHASAPNQTWPNRFFVHTGTANGYVDNDPPHFPYEMETIFNRFEAARRPWKVYFHDMPQSLTLAKLWPHAEHFRLYAEFREDARTGNLPDYAFIEPRYFADLTLPNDMHPPHNVTMGEQLVADVYNALRQGPKWTSTLLVVTFDEHGGCYDHVPPPAAVSPGDAATLAAPFQFDRYGVRVPAVIVSPYVRPGTVARPPGQVPFDHTSIIKTLRTRFPLGPALSNREAAAPDLDSVLSLPRPDNLGPEEFAPLPFSPSPGDLAVAHARPLNHMQRALLSLAAHLPAPPPGSDLAAIVATHIAALRAQTATVEATAGKDMIDAGAFIRRRLSGLFAAV